MESDGRWSLAMKACAKKNQVNESVSVMWSIIEEPRRDRKVRL